MPKNNIKILNKFELEQFVKRYSFENSSEYIIVRVNGFNRPTLQNKSKIFSVFCKGRYLNITPEAVKLWEDNFPNKNLIEVQQAINTLILMYQQINVNDVKKVLNNEI